MIGSVSHCPQQLNFELLRTSYPVIFDCETTGLDVLSDHILSYGFRIRTGETIRNYIIFTNHCKTLSIQPFIIKDGEIKNALNALTRRDLVLVGHNIKFDLSMLRREGVKYFGEVRDTQTILKMLDQDRGFSSDKTAGRKDLRAPWRRTKWLDYRLKHVAAQICGIKPFFTPDCLDGVNYEKHTKYLTYDLYVTELVYEKLWSRMLPKQKLFYKRLASPLTHLLCDLREVGVRADPDFMQKEIGRLTMWMARISKHHNELFGHCLSQSDQQLRSLLFEIYGLPKKQRKKGTEPSIDSGTLASLVVAAANDEIRESLKLISAYRALNSQRQRLEGYLKEVRTDSRIHSSFDEAKQTSGRISSTNPNLQQISNTKVVLPGTRFEVTVKARNLLSATPNFILLGADIDQADIRMLAERIENCRLTTKKHLENLHRQRWSQLAAHLGKYNKFRTQCFNKDFVVARPEPLPNFDPRKPSQLVADFRNLTDDLYARIATNITGRTITKSDNARGIFKTVVLAQINGQSVGSLSKTLSCDLETAKKYVSRLFRVYPDISGCLALLRQELAITGKLSNWAGRIRTHTAHYWMVSEERVHVLLTYRDGHRYWFDVSPIRPSLRNLTCYVHRVWSVRDPRGPKKDRLIFTDSRGRIGTRRYPQLDKPSLYNLPVRNLPWSNIRRVRKLLNGSPTEEAKYEGFDATARSIINSVMQGGTSDLTTLMALRCQKIVDSNQGRLLLMVHDELVWEFPLDHRSGFGGFVRILVELQNIIQRPPSASFNVPISVGMKYGRRFGELIEI